MSTIFFTSQEIKNALFDIKTLDQKGREIVFEVFSKYMDEGKITEAELELVVRDLTLNRIKYGLSIQDIENIKNLKGRSEY